MGKRRKEKDRRLVQILNSCFDAKRFMSLVSEKEGDRLASIHLKGKVHFCVGEVNDSPLLTGFYFASDEPYGEEPLPYGSNPPPKPEKKAKLPKKK